MIELDTRGLLCPLPVLKLRKAIQNINPNEKIRLITDDPAAIVDVPHFCNEQGYQITESLQEKGHGLFIIKC
ncbi:MAG: sulfurtransferase TusA family protein [Paracoccaceae bacterium]